MMYRVYIFFSWLNWWWKLLLLALLLLLFFPLLSFPSSHTLITAVRLSIFPLRVPVVVFFSNFLIPFFAIRSLCAYCSHLCYQPLIWIFIGFWCFHFSSYQIRQKVGEEYFVSWKFCDLFVFCLCLTGFHGNPRHRRLVAGRCYSRKYTTLGLSIFPFPLSAIRFFESPFMARALSVSFLFPFSPCSTHCLKYRDCLAQMCFCLFLCLME